MFKFPRRCRICNRVCRPGDDEVWFDHNTIELPATYHIACVEELHDIAQTIKNAGNTERFTKLDE